MKESTIIMCEAIGRISAVLEMEHLTDKEKLNRISNIIADTKLLEVEIK